MSIVEHMSLNLEFTLSDATYLCIHQRGFTTHLQWLIGCFQTHVKDSQGTDKCFFPLMIALGQWNGVTAHPVVSGQPPAADLTLGFNFRTNLVIGNYGDEHFTMELVEWMGTPLFDLPFVEPWEKEELTEEEIAELGELV